MPELQPGDPRRLGSFDVVERLGEGGQGVVYLGVDPASGTKAAVKLLRADLTEDASARNRFVREAQAAKQVARFCTAQVLEGVPDDLRPLLAACLAKEPERRPTAQQLMMSLIGSGPAAQTRMDPAAATT